MNRQPSARPRPYLRPAEDAGAASGIRLLVAGHVAVLVGIAVVVALFVVLPRSDVGILGLPPRPASLFGAMFATALVGFWATGHLHSLWWLRRLALAARTGLDPVSRSAAARAVTWTATFFFVTAMLAHGTLSAAGPLPRAWLMALGVGLLLASFLLGLARAGMLHQGVAVQGVQPVPGGAGLPARQLSVAAASGVVLALAGLALTAATVAFEGPSAPGVVVHGLAGVAIAVQAAILAQAGVVSRRGCRTDGWVDLAVLDRGRALHQRAALAGLASLVLITAGVAVGHRTVLLGVVPPGLLVLLLFLQVNYRAGLVCIRLGDVGPRRARRGILQRHGA